MEKKLVYYGGSGTEWFDEVGEYEVKYDEFGEKKERTFFSLKEAVSFFDSLSCEKALWDVGGMPELLDAYIYG